MSFNYTAIFSRNFILIFALVFFMLGISKAIANIEIIAPTWEGKTLKHIVLDGSDSRQQLLVNYIQSDGSLFDKTRSVQLIAEPEGLVSITNGLVEPLSNGKGKIFISDAFNQESTITFEIKNVDVYKQVNFANSVVPLFTKHGCNGGGAMGSRVVRMVSGCRCLVLNHRKILSIYLGSLEGVGFSPLHLNAVFFC